MPFHYTNPDIEATHVLSVARVILQEWATNAAFRILDDEDIKKKEKKRLTTILCTIQCVTYTI
jgi:hypothetical protein